MKEILLFSLVLLSFSAEISLNPLRVLYAIDAGSDKESNSHSGFIYQIVILFSFNSH